MSGQEEKAEEDQAGLLKVAICQFYINAPAAKPARSIFGNPGPLDRPVIGGVRFGIELTIRGYNCLAGYFPNTCIGDVNRFENFSVGSTGVSNRIELAKTMVLFSGQRSRILLTKDGSSCASTAASAGWSNAAQQAGIAPHDLVS